MKHIVVDSVCLRHFRSFVGATAIAFTPASGLKFVAGNNRLEPALGANGAGKSTVFDAVCWALYGTSLRGLRASDLVSYGRKVTEVLLILNIDDDQYAINRTAPPNRVTVNGVAATQPEVEALVGLSKDRFVHSVVFGQGVPLFIDLPAPERGNLLDEVLDLELWMRAAGRAGDRHSELNTQLQRLRLDTATLTGRLQGLPDTADLAAREEAFEIDRRARLNALLERYDKLERDIAEAGEPAPVDHSKVAKRKQAYDDEQHKLAEQRRITAGLQRDLDAVERELAFFADNQSCPTCGQAITKAFAHSHTAELQARRMELADQIAVHSAAARNNAERVQHCEKIWQRAVQAVAETERMQAVAEAQLRAAKREHHDVQQLAIRTRNERNPYAEQRQAVLAQKAELEQAVRAKRTEEEKRTAELARYDYWRQGFRKVRAFCLETVLAELTLETRNALLSLGLIDWSIAFAPYSETAKGGQRLGVTVNVQPPHRERGQFNTLSGGEGQRARLAASLGLANLIQRWAGVRWDFEVWDEPTAWLSEQGVEDLLESLSYRADAQNKAIYVCDHRSLLHSAFSETYMVTKDHTGSHWERA